MNNVKLLWFRTEAGRMDHLLRTTNQDHPGGVSWCNFDLRSAIEAIGNGPKCGLCLRALQSYTQTALVELPEVVSEAFLVQVTRPAGGSVDVAELIERKLAGHRTWQVTVTPYRAEQP